MRKTADIIEGERIDFIDRQTRHARCHQLEICFVPFSGNSIDIFIFVERPAVCIEGPRSVMFDYLAEPWSLRDIREMREPVQPASCTCTLHPFLRPSASLNGFGDIAADTDTSAGNR